MSPNLRRIIPSLIVSCLLLSSLAIYAVARSGSVSNAISEWREEPILVKASNFSVGRVEPSALVKATFTISNPSKRVISIVGDYIECNCVTCDTVWPARIEPASSIKASYSMRAPAVEGEFSQRIILYTDAAGRKEISLSISGETKEISGNNAIHGEPVKDIR